MPFDSEALKIEPIVWVLDNKEHFVRETLVFICMGSGHSGTFCEGDISLQLYGFLNIKEHFVRETLVFICMGSGH